MSSAYGETTPRRPVAPRPAETTGRHSGARPGQSGIPAVAAVALLIVLSAAGGVIDLLSGTGLRVFYGAAFVLGCALAALLVRLSEKLVVVFAPPLVFGVASLLGAAFTSRQLGRQIISLDTVSETFLRLIDPGKAPYLLAGFAVALAIVLIRMALVRR